LNASKIFYYIHNKYYRLYKEKFSLYNLYKMNKFIAIQKNEIKQNIIEHMNPSATSTSGTSTSGTSTSGTSTSGANTSGTSSSGTSSSGTSSSGTSSSGTSSSGPSTPEACTNESSKGAAVLTNNSTCITNESKWKNITSFGFTSFAANAKCVNNRIPALKRNKEGGLDYKCM
jgi:hypothetical protein